MTTAPPYPAAGYELGLKALLSSSSSHSSKWSVLESCSSTCTTKVMNDDVSDLKLCLLYSHDEGDVGYAIYIIDASKIGGYDLSDDDDVRKIKEKKLPLLKPDLELPSKDYPVEMGSFALGSRIYLVGGEVVPRPPRTRPGKNLTLANYVYFIDTAAFPLSVVRAGKMKGGKTRPLVAHLNGLVYVLSHMPGSLTHFRRNNVFFESFDPVENIWNPLPNPPFYDYNVGCYGGRGLVISFTVIDSSIVFLTSTTSSLFAFNVANGKWEIIPTSENQWKYFPFRITSLSLSDSVWATAGGSHLSTLRLIPKHGFVVKHVEGLEPIHSFGPPCLAYNVYYNLLQSKNGWFCLVKSGLDAKRVCKGKPCVLATVFRLVEKRNDKFCLYNILPWPPNQKWAPWLDKDGFSYSDEVVGETPVLGAVDVRSSLFKVVVDHSNEITGWLTCFLLKTSSNRI